MAETTSIAWTDATWNGWIGCAKISPGCDHCYAEVSTPSRTKKILWGPLENRHRTSEKNWTLPLQWNARHEEFYAEHGRRRRVFCASLSDVFDNRVDPQWRVDLWALIRATPNLDWLILTKRVGNVVDMLPPDWGQGYANVWLGISVVNQIEANRDIPKLLRIPALIRWLSMEPLLENVRLNKPRGDRGEKLDWVICGGESGHFARPMKAEWIINLRSECEQDDIAFFFKQWGGTSKDKGGCHLDGFEVKAWPAAA